MSGSISWQADNGLLKCTASSHASQSQARSFLQNTVAPISQQTLHSGARRPGPLPGPPTTPPLLTACGMASSPTPPPPRSSTRRWLGLVEVSGRRLRPPEAASMGWREHEFFCVRNAWCRLLVRHASLRRVHHCGPRKGDQLLPRLTAKDLMGAHVESTVGHCRIYTRSHHDRHTKRPLMGPTLVNFSLRDAHPPDTGGQCNG